MLVNKSRQNDMVLQSAINGRASRHFSRHVILCADGDNAVTDHSDGVRHGKIIVDGKDSLGSVNNCSLR